MFLSTQSSAVILRMWASILSRLKGLFWRYNCDTKLLRSTEARLCCLHRLGLWKQLLCGRLGLRGLCVRLGLHRETHHDSLNSGFRWFRKSVRNKSNHHNHRITQSLRNSFNFSCFSWLSVLTLETLCISWWIWQASLQLMPSFIPPHRTLSTWPVTAAAISRRSSWHKEIVRRQETLKKPLVRSGDNISSFEICWNIRMSGKQVKQVTKYSSFLKFLGDCHDSVIPMTWRKASQNPRATLQSAGWADGFTAVMFWFLLSDIVSITCHTDSEVQMAWEVCRAPFLAGFQWVWRAGINSWTAHLDAQSMQAGIWSILKLESWFSWQSWVENGWKMIWT